MQAALKVHIGGWPLHMDLTLDQNVMPLEVEVMNGGNKFSIPLACSRQPQQTVSFFLRW